MPKEISEEQRKALYKGTYFFATSNYLGFDRNGNLIKARDEVFIGISQKGSNIYYALKNVEGKIQVESPSGKTLVVPDKNIFLAKIS